MKTNLNLMSQKVDLVQYYADRVFPYLSAVAIGSIIVAWNGTTFLIVSVFFASLLFSLAILINMGSAEGLKNLREWKTVTHLSVRYIPRNSRAWTTIASRLITILEGYARQASVAIQDRERADKFAHRDMRKFGRTPDDLDEYPHQYRSGTMTWSQAWERAGNEHDKFLRAWDLLSPCIPQLKGKNPDQWRESLSPKNC
jgi:hypothetical protein